MHPHVAHRTLGLLLAVCGMAVSSTLLIVISVGGRRLKHRLRGLLDVFDPGTALVSDDFVFGVFHGRPAWVSLGSSGLSSAVQVGVKGRFSVPFQIQAIDSRRSATIRQVLLWAPMFVVFFIDINLDRRVDVWSLLGPCLSTLPLWIVSLIELRRRRRSASRMARIDMALAATRLTPFETIQPDRVRAALNNSEIRDALGRVFDSCHADGVKSEGGGFGTQASLEAFWFLPRKVLDISLLNKDNVRGMLAELSNVCVGAEQAFPEAKRI